MAIKDWPSLERPREKLVSSGAAQLSDAELLAIFLRTGSRGKTAVDMGRELLSKFGSLRLILESTQQEFCQMKGLGLAKYVQIQAVFEMALRYLNQTLKQKDVLKNPKDTQRYLTACLRKYPYEVFACLFLDSGNQVIHFSELFQGTINAATIYAREIVKEALKCNAAGVIFAHNHPSGRAEPSAADKQVTRELQQALSLVDIKVLDHIVIGEGAVTSFAERGWL